MPHSTDTEPWWCTTCEVLIPTSGLTHMGGDNHGLRRLTADDEPHNVTISFHRQNTWTEVVPDHPGGFQWTGPGVYVIATNNESKTQVAEVRITLAHDLDGNDNSDNLMIEIAYALRRVYSQEKP